MTATQPASSAPAHEYASGRAYSDGRLAHEGLRAAAETFAWLLVNAAGGPFKQRQPTRAQCRTAELDFFAAKVREGRSVRGMVATRLAALGLSPEQVEQWAGVSNV